MLVVPCCVGGFFFVFQTEWFKAPVNEATFDRLHQGMSDTEVLAIMGSPTSSEAFGRRVRGRSGGGGPALLHWQQGDNEISVFIDQGKATSITGTFTDEKGSHFRQQ
jgi:hypothetical protein